jgi:acetyl-CoA synthetase
MLTLIFEGEFFMWNTYAPTYQHSISDNEKFWDEQAHSIDWFTPYTTVYSGNLPDANVKWFEDGTLNVSYNCIDRHLKNHGDKVAIIWEGDTPGTNEKITYKQLHERVCQFANVLKARGVKKGDRVCLYMPMIPEAAIAMLACTRIGAVHSVVFGGFSPDSIQSRILDANCTCVITSNVGRRGGKCLPFKNNVDAALDNCPSVHTVLVMACTDADTHMEPGRDVWYHDEVKNISSECAPEPMSAEDPLFILYTSGSTGTPKGVLHTTGGYLVYVSATHKEAFDLRDDDIYWCTADVGWITGHSYIVYGPLANGSTTVMFEGIPTYPDVSRFWNVVDKYKITIFYTAPTAIRALMAHGDKPVTKTSRASLRLLGTVGEPINPEAWHWYDQVVGNGKCPIVDTWWQTETGGFMLLPLVDKDKQKPGAAMKPFYGIEPMLMDEKGKEVIGAGEGALVIKQPWPGMMRTVYGDHDRFIRAYLTDYPGFYFTGDGARRDEDGDLWIVGRMDDVLNVSGHRFGTAEIESALVLYHDVAEAAVVGFPHDIKGEGIYGYVTLMDGVELTSDLAKTLVQFVRTQIGPIATIDHIHFTAEVPKTRSGKIMRRILRKIAAGDTENLGDISTLANPECVADLIENKRGR